MKVLLPTLSVLALGLSTGASLADKHHMEVEFHNKTSITVYYGGSDATKSNPGNHTVAPDGHYNDKWDIEKCDSNNSWDGSGMTVAALFTNDVTDEIGYASYTYKNKPDKKCHLAFDEIKMFNDDYRLIDKNVSGGVRKLTLEEAN